MDRRIRKEKPVVNTKLIITFLLAVSVLLIASIIYIVIKGNMNRSKESPSPAAAHKADTRQILDEEKVDSKIANANPETASEGSVKNISPEADLSAVVFYPEGRSGDTEKLISALTDWQSAISVQKKLIDKPMSETIVAVKKGFPGLKNALLNAMPDEKFAFLEDYTEDNSTDITIILGDTTTLER